MSGSDDVVARGRAIFEQLRQARGEAPTEESHPGPGAGPPSGGDDATGSPGTERTTSEGRGAGELPPSDGVAHDGAPRDEPASAADEAAEERAGEATEERADDPVDGRVGDVEDAPGAADEPGVSEDPPTSAVVTEAAPTATGSPEVAGGAPTVGEVGVPVEEAGAPVAAAGTGAPSPAAVLGDLPLDTPALAPLRPGRPLPRVLAVANQKGGVGKTTTAVNLGAALAELGHRVLVVDLDPQGNASTGLGINNRGLEVSMYDVILNDVPLEDCIEPTAVRNLFVAPANLDLAGAEIELVPAFSRELKLRRALEPVRGDYDVTLVDCPPSLGLLTVNALAAADEVLVPIQCEYYALEGLGQLLRNIQLVQGNLNQRLELSTIVLVMYDARTKLSDQVATEVRAHFGDRVCRTLIPRTVRLSEAPSYGQPILTFDPSSRGAIAYREVAKEVIGGTS